MAICGDLVGSTPPNRRRKERRRKQQAYGWVADPITGEAVWKTPWHPMIALSKLPSSIKSALANVSLSLAPSSPTDVPASCHFLLIIHYLFSLKKARKQVIEKQKVNGKKGKQRPEREIKLIHWFPLFTDCTVATYIGRLGTIKKSPTHPENEK